MCTSPINSAGSKTLSTAATYQIAQSGSLFFVSPRGGDADENNESQQRTERIELSEIWNERWSILSERKRNGTGMQRTRHLGAPFYSGTASNALCPITATTITMHTYSCDRRHHHRRTLLRGTLINPFSTAVSFWGQLGTYYLEFELFAPKTGLEF